MKERLTQVKKFMKDHKIQIVAGAVAASVIYLQGRGINNLNNFLTEKDLFNEYYATTLDEIY